MSNTTSRSRRPRAWPTKQRSAWRTIGCRIASRRRSAAGSPKTRCPNRRRSPRQCHRIHRETPVQRRHRLTARCKQAVNDNISVKQPHAQPPQHAGRRALTHPNRAGQAQNDHVRPAAALRASSAQRPAIRASPALAFRTTPQNPGGPGAAASQAHRPRDCLGPGLDQQRGVERNIHDIDDNGVERQPRQIDFELRRTGHAEARRVDKQTRAVKTSPRVSH